MGKYSKELDILFFKLINESERDILKLAIKIHLKKKKSGHGNDLNKISGNLEISHPL